MSSFSAGPRGAASVAGAAVLAFLLGLAAAGELGARAGAPPRADRAIDVARPRVSIPRLSAFGPLPELQVPAATAPPAAPAGRPSPPRPFGVPAPATRPAPPPTGAPAPSSAAPPAPEVGEEDPIDGYGFESDAPEPAESDAVPSAPEPPAPEPFPLPSPPAAGEPPARPNALAQGFEGGDDP